MEIPLQRQPSEPRRALERSTAEAPPSLGAVSGRAAVLLAVVAGLLVHVLGTVALLLRPEGSSTAAWWPATGVAVAAVALVSPNRRLLVVAAVGLGALAANLATDRPWLVVTGFAIANALTPWIWVRLMTRGRPDRPQLLTTDDFGRFVLAAFAATGVAGLLAGLCAEVAGTGGLLTTWASFVAAQAASILILVPFALPLPASLCTPRPVELAAQLAALVATILVAFIPEQTLPLAVLPLPALVWAAVRLPARWVSAELIVAGILTSVLTTLGQGPYAEVTDRGFAPELVGLLLQVALLVYALVTLPLTLSVHRQRAALNAARDSYELVQSVLAGATSTAIIGCNRAGIVTVFNTGAEKILGWSAEDVVGRCTPERFHLREEIVRCAHELGVPPGMAVFSALVDRGGAAGQERRDWTMVRKDGNRLTMSLRLTARSAASGEPLGHLAVGEDVTERRRTEAALRDALEREREGVERLEQLDQAKTTFVSTVSHELRTPMTSVLGYTDMLLGETAGPVTSEQRGMLEAARRNGRRLLRLIEDLLTVSSIENGTFTFDSRPVDLRTATRGALEAVRPLLADRDLELRVDLGPGELEVVGDPDHLERVALNLLVNAVKFTPDGGHVEVRLGEQLGNAVLEVSDTGIGIPPDEQPQLFERFYRTTTAQELEVPGTGLGLSIVRTIVVSHGGRVAVRSSPGAGTTFRVDLPLSLGTAPPAGPVR